MSLAILTPSLPQPCHDHSPCLQCLLPGSWFPVPSLPQPSPSPLRPAFPSFSHPGPPFPPSHLHPCILPASPHPSLLDFFSSLSLSLPPLPPLLAPAQRPAFLSPLLPRFTTRIALEAARDTCCLSPTSASHQVREARQLYFPLRCPQKNREQSPASFTPVSALLSQKRQLSEPEGSTQIRFTLHASDQDQAQRMKMTYRRAHTRRCSGSQGNRPTVSPRPAPCPLYLGVSSVPPWS